MRFQQNLVPSSPAFRMQETYRKIGESTFAIHPQVCNCSFVYLENFPLYSQSYLQLLQICLFHLLPQLCYAHPLREFYNLSLSTQSILDQLLLLSVCARFARNIQLRSPFFQLSAPRRNVQHDTTLTILLHSPLFSLLFCDAPPSAPPLATSAGDLDLSLSLENGDCIGNLSASRS